MMENTQNTQKMQRAQQVRAQGLAHAVAHEVSGLTRQAYADQAGISVHKLDYWRTFARLLKAGGDKPAAVTAAATNTTLPASRAVSAGAIQSDVVISSYFEAVVCCQ